MLREVFSQTGANSRVLETDGEDMQNRDHASTSRPRTRPRIRASRSTLAGNARCCLPLANATYEQYERMKALGLGELDKSGVSELTFKDRHASA